MLRHHLARFSFIAALLLLGGQACYPFTSGTPTPYDSGQSVNISQPRPPDCGLRNPNRFLPHFSIPDPNVIVGEAMYIDASCSVGRIVSLRWDFDTHAWPAPTPTEQRFEPEVLVDHVDKNWAANYQPPSGWPLNNFGPFLLTYTPTTAGSRSMRLWAKDWQGNEHVVMATYTVSPAAPSTQALSAQAPLRPHFLLTAEAARGERFAVPRYFDRRPVYLPAYLTYEARAIGTTGAITDYAWLFRETVIDTGKTPLWFTYTNIIDYFRFSDDLQSQHRTVGISYPYDAEVRLMLNQANPVSDSYVYKMTDHTTVATLIPQLSFIPGDQVDPFSLAGSYVSFKNNGPGIFLEPGQSFALQNFSLPGWQRARNGIQTGQLIVEFDPGTGVYEEVKRLSSFWIDTTAKSITEIARGTSRYLESAFVRKDYQAPSLPGQYRARLRVTEEADAGAPNFSRRVADTDILYEVKFPEPTLVITPSQPTANVRDVVTFDASLSRAAFRSYHWQIRKKDTNDLVKDELRQHNQGNYNTFGALTHRFAEAGVYSVAVQAVALQDGRYYQTQIDYTVTAPVPAPPASTIPAPAAPVAGQVSVTVNPIGAGGQPIAPPIHPDDSLLFMIQGLSAAMHQRIEWDFDGDGANDYQCDVTEPYTGAGYSTCISSRKDAPQSAGTHTARLTVTTQTGAQYSVTVQYNVAPDNRAVAAGPIQIPNIMPELYAENKNGVRMRNHPEIYENDSIIIRLNGLNEVAKKVQYDFQNDGTWDVDCEVKLNQGALQCLHYRRVSWRTPPGDYVLRIKIHFSGSAGQLDYTLPYTVVPGERPADRNS